MQSFLSYVLCISVGSSWFTSKQRSKSKPREASSTDFEKLFEDHNNRKKRAKSYQRIEKVQENQKFTNDKNVGTHSHRSRRETQNPVENSACGKKPFLEKLSKHPNISKEIIHREKSIIILLSVFYWSVFFSHKSVFRSKDFLGREAKTETMNNNNCVD